jgi:hypothetical protein
MAPAHRLVHVPASHNRGATIRDAVVAAFTSDGYTVGGDIAGWPTEIAASPVVAARISRPSRITIPFLNCVMVALAEQLDESGLTEIWKTVGLYVRDRVEAEADGRPLGQSAIPVLISPNVHEDAAALARRNLSRPGLTYVAPAIIDTATARVIYARGFGPGLGIRIPLSHTIRRLVEPAVSS